MKKIYVWMVGKYEKREKSQILVDVAYGCSVV